MRSRNLHSINDLIVSNYKTKKMSSGKYLHEFTPKSTATIYQFEANGSKILIEGEHYNVAFVKDEIGHNIVELSALSLASEINPNFSWIYSQKLAKENRHIEKAKNDQRVYHTAQSGYYWGKKYAWRMFGMVLSKGAFFAYLMEIKHPAIVCVTNNPALPYESKPSTAYLEEGLSEAMELLIGSAKKVSATYYTSPHYSKRFTIKGVPAITDKK